MTYNKGDYSISIAPTSGWPDNKPNYYPPVATGLAFRYPAGEGVIFLESIVTLTVNHFLPFSGTDFQRHLNLLLTSKNNNEQDWINQYYNRNNI